MWNKQRLLWGGVSGSALGDVHNTSCEHHHLIVIANAIANHLRIMLVCADISITILDPDTDGLHNTHSSIAIADTNTFCDDTSRGFAIADTDAINNARGGVTVIDCPSSADTFANTLSHPLAFTDSHPLHIALRIKHSSFSQDSDNDSLAVIGAHPRPLQPLPCGNNCHDVLAAGGRRADV